MRSWAESALKSSRACSWMRCLQEGTAGTRGDSPRIWAPRACLVTWTSHCAHPAQLTLHAAQGPVSPQAPPRGTNHRSLLSPNMALFIAGDIESRREILSPWHSHDLEQHS